MGERSSRDMVLVQMRLCRWLSKQLTMDFTVSFTFGRMSHSKRRKMLMYGIRTCGEYL